jgi:hypothetical protein
LLLSALQIFSEYATLKAAAEKPCHHGNLSQQQINKYKSKRYQMAIKLAADERSHSRDRASQGSNERLPSIGKKSERSGISRTEAPNVRTVRSN